MMKIHNLEQGTPEWFAVREMKMTASHAQAIASAGAGLKTYVKSLLIEKYSSAEVERYSGEHTERGNDLEEHARSIYELETGNTVTEVGFIEHDEHTGCSPDGLVKEDGGVEIKSLMDSKHFDVLVGDSKIDSAHMWQIQMNLMITGREWWDYVLYNPNFEKSLLVERVKPDPEKIEKLQHGLEVGKQLLKDYEKKYKALCI